VVGEILGAMSEENVEIVRRLIEANQSGDLEVAAQAMEALSHPDGEYTRVTADLEPTRAYRGPGWPRQYLADLAEVWGSWSSEPEDVVEVAPDTVVATIRFSAAGKESGAPIEGRLGFLVTLRDGQVLKAQTYSSRGEALRAAGLGE
jgi:ketosteroid isomerase-like protein